MLLLLNMFLLTILPDFYISWLAFAPEVLLVQTIITYYLYRVTLVKNVYQLIGYATLLLTSFAIYLFLLQFDVFACFLLVAESIVMLFALSILMHLNYTNLCTPSKVNAAWLLSLLVAMCPVIAYTDQLTYWVDWYATQSSQYNDLLPQYIYFYLVDSPVVMIIGLWLLVVTILLVHLILSMSLSRVSTTTELSYTRKAQNIWTQWYKKPFLRFFKK